MESFQGGEKRSLFDKYFSFVEALRPSDKFLYLLVLLVLISSLTYTLLLFGNQHKTTIASGGGTLSEGIIGTPRFINPVLAITRADLDMVALIYSGLMKLSSDGTLVPDIADTVTISEDGLVYNITLRQDTRFHDGTSLTAHDVAYTVGLIQDPALKSPLRGNWNDVVVEVINDHELNFVLEEPYTPFIENLTVGILPKHIWNDLSIEQLPFSQHNTEPIGSGPYQLMEVDYNSSGLINAYTLGAFPRDESSAKISTLDLRFYQNEESLIAAFDEKEFMNTVALGSDAMRYLDTDKYRIIEEPLPRVFSVFINQNKSAVLRDPAVREALSLLIDRTALIDNVLSGRGTPTTSPIPPGFIEYASSSSSTSPFAFDSDNLLDRRQAAETLLLDAGWEKLADGSWSKEIDDVATKLAVTITTENSKVFQDTSAFIKSVWEAIGVEVSVSMFEKSDLVQVIIRPRDYEMLLFGADVGRSLDLYPFWHSSQKNDPGLNVALYTNISADALLETARTTQDPEEFTAAVADFEAEIVSETPAIFLYSPSFTYVVHQDVITPEIKRLVRPHERFSNIADWHMKVSEVWPIFTKFVN